jgi:hypothetical protein
MMNRKRSLLLLILISLYAISSPADVAPEPGYKTVYFDIVLEPQEDFDDYRFFLQSGDKAREVLVKKGVRTTVGSLGGGARYSDGVLLAILKKDLVGVPASNTSGNFGPEPMPFSEGRFARAVKLVEHNFTGTVRAEEASGWSDPVYRLERISGVVTATKISDAARTYGRNGDPGNKKAKEPEGMLNGFFSLDWSLIVIGGLIALVIVLIGLRIFRWRKGSS